MADKHFPLTEQPDQLYSHDTTKRFSKILSKDDFLFLYEMLCPVKTDWFNFGLALDLPEWTLEEIKLDNRKCDSCFRETLSKLLETSQLTYNKITAALKMNILQQNNLAMDIERRVLALDSSRQTQNSMLGILSLEKLCLLPVDKVWYQFGLWLGVEQQKLIKIKKTDEKKKFLFKAVLKSLYDSVDSKRLCKGFTDDQTGQAQRLIEKKMIGLMIALIKVGKRDVAENICSNRGVSLTKLTGSKPPPECVVMYADYLKSKYREMSLLPDPDWPPSIATKEHYTNLALIQKERNTKEDINNVSKDYAHGNIDSIIAEKTSIDLEETFYPIINPKTNESRLTILMDGAPGVGKTTITRKVCIDWAEGDVLPEYQLVILVPLRELKFLSNKQLHLSDIFPSDNEEIRRNVIEHMKLVSGAGTLIIFDGFDELSFQERNFLQKSLVLDIIKGEMLHRCSVMITSRPYASQPLRSLSRVNRHIEVLGFTEEQIHDCVCTNIPGKEGDKLIRELKERLDIGSLCYIPLNCRILLFVFKIEGFNVPSTITELYEIFLLHTIKRFAQFKKVELDEDVFSEIISANKLKELPRVITVQLNALSKFALEGIEQGKLVFNDKNLKEHLSFGLLNSLHCFTTTGEAAFFQFLHLTIQEFLAAKYVASDAITDKERKSFMRSNVENETYRMTMLFLAGLTQFSFLSSGDSLLKPQSTFLSGSSEKERILFLSQVNYESRSSSDCILSHLNGMLDMSGYPLNRFDCLVLAHVMSNTPRDFVWEIIDLSNCGITSYSVLLETKHCKHTRLPAIIVSKTLNFISRRRMVDFKQKVDIPFTLVLALLSNIKDSPLKELTLHVPIKWFRGCQQMVQLSQALFNNKSLRYLEVVYCFLNKIIQNNNEHKLILSKEDFVLQSIPSNNICSNYFIQLLKVVSVESKRFEINDARILKDCSTCCTSGEDAVKSLCEFLRQHKNIEQIKFSKCCLKGCTMQSIISSLSESLTSEICFAEIMISDTELLEMLEYLPRKCRFHFSTNEISIVFKTKENYLDVSNHDEFKAFGYEKFLTNSKCVFPSRFTGLSIETYGGALECLSENTYLKMLTLILGSDDHWICGIQQDKVALKRRVLELNKSLTAISLKISSSRLNDYSDIIAEAVRQKNTFCMEITVINDRPSHIHYTGLITLLNSLKSTPVQKFSFKNVCLNTECTAVFIEVLSYNKHLTELAMEGRTYFTESSEPRRTWQFFSSLQMEFLTKLTFNGNKLEADGTVALLDFLRLNPQLTVLEASDCYLTDDLFTDTRYWKTSSLKELAVHCSSNDISIEGWTNLFRSLRHNTSLIKLNCFCHADIGEMLNEMIVYNKCIQYITISEYSFNSRYESESLARALVQNFTIKEIVYGSWFKRESVYDLKREIQKLKRDKNVTISPELNLKIHERTEL